MAVHFGSGMTCMLVREACVMVNVAIRKARACVVCE